MRFLEQEGRVTCLQFYQAVQDFKDLPEDSQQQQQALVKVSLHYDDIMHASDHSIVSIAHAHSTRASGICSDKMGSDKARPRQRRYCLKTGRSEIVSSRNSNEVVSGTANSCNRHIPPTQIATAVSYLAFSLLRFELFCPVLFPAIALSSD